VAVLVGLHSYQLDDKGRIPLPGKFREALAGGATMTLGIDRCVWVFPQEEYDRRAREIAEHPISDAQATALARMFFANSEPATMDKQGRMGVSTRLREIAQLGGKVVVVGRHDRLEIWDRPAWDRYDEQFLGPYLAGTLFGERRQG
jgi:MraZ protein